MQTNPISYDHIRYNAAEQMFEARVTVHTTEGARIYACSVPGDLLTPLETAANALQHAALHQHRAAPGLFSARTRRPLRAPTRPTWRKRLLGALPLMRRVHAA